MSTTERPAVDVDLLVQAASLAVETQHCSRRTTSRKLRLGWGATGDALDVLEQAGVVGQDDGDEAGSRLVLVQPDGLDEAVARVRLVVDSDRRDAPDEASADEPGAELAVRDEGTVAEVVDAELVPKPPPARPTPVTIVGTIVVRPVQVVVVRPVQVIAAATKTVATDRRTKAAGRALGRNLLYVPAGALFIGRRLWEAKTNSRYERIMRGAEAVGNYERLEEWEARAEKARERRHNRRMDWLQAPGKLIQAVTMAMAGFTAALIALGVVLAVGYRDVSWVVVPISRFIDLVVWISWAVTIAWGPLILALPWLLLLTLWHFGRVAGWTPAVLAPTGKRTEVEITPSIVVVAYRDCGIAELAKRIRAMEDAGAAMVGPITRAGNGQEFDVTPPRGAASLRDIVARRDRIAETMGRHPYELHLSITERGVIRNWAAFPGALDEPIGTSPLMIDAEMRADYRRGQAPWGVSLRGDAVAISPFQRHVAITGMSNQGKTRVLIALALWLALDKNVEFRIADLKGMNDKTGVSDWEPFRDIASVFIAGPTDDHVVAATEMLEGAVEEMNRRLTDGGTWKPLIVIVDEAQKAYMCPKVGPDKRPYGGRKATSRFFTAAREIHNQGRVVDTLLWQGTQDPTNENFPELVREGAHIRGCLAIGTEAKAAMGVGEKAVEGGAAPHMLRPGLDKGTLVVAGDLSAFGDVDPSQASVTVRTYFIDHEAAMEIAERAKAIRGPVRRLDDEEELRDLVADVADGLGPDEIVRATDMAARLRKLAPTYRPYRHLNGKQLVEQLRAEGVEVKEKDGVAVIRRDRVYRVLDDREDGK
jgi:S-DNA-T family DNA segregation ATPase FtsK/SpoIIIE